MLPRGPDIGEANMHHTPERALLGRMMRREGVAVVESQQGV